MHNEPAKHASAMDWIGKSLGQYQLLRLLGTGGMGQVFEALDTTLKRRVAVKIIRTKHRRKPHAKQRFLREARILSQVDDPHICRVLEFVEQGDVEALVVEYIQGKSLESRMDGGFDEPLKLQIASQLLQGVASAHRMGIVHRDLKPGNIMLTPQGNVKILDFGVAMVLADESDVTIDMPPGKELTDAMSRALETHMGGIVGTPRYMSPEQARGDTATTASDIYALGLIFQHLFTGQSPYPTSTSPVGLLWRVMNAETHPITGLNKELTHLIQSMTQLNPAQRPSASELLSLLNRYLDRPTRILHRTLRFTAVAALGLAAIVSSYAYVTTSRAQAQTQQTLAESQAVNSFLKDVLSAASPERMGRDVKMVDVLDDALVKSEERFAQQPLVLARTLETLGETFYAMGSREQSVACFEKSRELRLQTQGEHHPDTLLSGHNLANLMLEMGRANDAETLEYRVWTYMEQTLGANHPQSLQCKNLYALIINACGRTSEAQTLWQQVVEAQRDHPDVPEAQRLIAMENLALCYMGQYRFQDAEPLLEASLEAKRAALGDNHPRTFDAMNNLAATWMRTGRTAQALTLLQKVHALERQHLGEKHPNSLNSMCNLAEALLREGRIDESEELLQQHDTLALEVLGPDHPINLSAPCRMAMVHWARGNLSEASHDNAKGLSALVAKMGPNQPFVLNQGRIQARIIRGLGDVEAAIERLQSLLQRCTAHLESGHAVTCGIARDLAACLRSQGRSDAADKLKSEYGPFFVDTDLPEQVK